MEDSTTDETDEEEEEEGSSSGSESDTEADSSDSPNSLPDSIPAESRSTRAARRQLRGVASAVELSQIPKEKTSTSEEVTIDIDGSGDGGPTAEEDVDEKLSDTDILKPWWRPFYKNSYDMCIDVGAKMSALFFILKKCSEIGDKVLIFSQSLFSLDLIEWFLAAIDRQWCMSQVGRRARAINLTPVCLDAL